MSYNSDFSEKELVHDLLMYENQIISLYNTGIIQTSSLTFRDSLNFCLTNVQDCQLDLLNAMNQRGWNQTKKANSNDIENAIKKYSKMSSELF